METFTRWTDPTIKELQQRIDEAIKYIKDNNNFVDYKDYNGKEENELLDLLKILEGKQIIVLDRYKNFYETAENINDEIAIEIQKELDKLIENAVITIGGEEYEDTIIETDES